MRSWRTETGSEYVQNICNSQRINIIIFYKTENGYFNIKWIK